MAADFNVVRRKFLLYGLHERLQDDTEVTHLHDFVALFVKKLRPK